MLIEPNSHLYVYVIARDYGFAPNPFHGICTLATCKPGIRKSAKVNDWILGIGGSRLGKARGKCILLMKVTEKIRFEKYWTDNRFRLKRPCRNGSNVMLVGDNIYHKDNAGNWIQEDSHHSNPDGTPNSYNIARDTGSTDLVLVSKLFLYFGEDAIPIDTNSLNYHPGLGYKKIDIHSCQNAIELIKTTYSSNKSCVNYVVSDPCQFKDSHVRVDQKTGKAT